MASAWCFHHSPERGWFFKVTLERDGGLHLWASSQAAPSCQRWGRGHVPAKPGGTSSEAWTFLSCASSSAPGGEFPQHPSQSPSWTITGAGAGGGAVASVGVRALSPEQSHLQLPLCPLSSEVALLFPTFVSRLYGPASPRPGPRRPDSICTSSLSREGRVLPIVLRLFRHPVASVHSASGTGLHQQETRSFLLTVPLASVSCVQEETVFAQLHSTSRSPPATSPAQSPCPRSKEGHPDPAFPNCPTRQHTILTN